MVYEITDIVREVLEEYARAERMRGSFASPHEGIAVIFEEVQELWNEVRKDGSLVDDAVRQRARMEAVQVAAMALRFLEDFG